MMILGGLLGLVIGIAFGLAQQSAWPDVIWKAALATYFSGLLMRWWGSVWMKCLNQVQSASVSTEHQPESKIANNTSSL